MLKRISYPLTRESPLYPGTPQVTFQEVRSLDKGDSANTTLITMSSHAGTHIDVPRHFCGHGTTVHEIIGDMLVLSPVYCIGIAAGPNAPIRISHLEPFAPDLRDAAGLLIRTGMHRHRADDPGSYCTEHPWIHPEVPGFLRVTCPSLQLFGTDTISISSPSHREEGRECHRAFLCENTPIILAEDLDLSDPVLATAPMMVTIIPIVADAPDGTPVQVFAEFLPEPSAPTRGNRT